MPVPGCTLLRPQLGECRTGGREVGKTNKLARAGSPEAVEPNSSNIPTRTRALDNKSHAESAHGTPRKAWARSTAVPSRGTAHSPEGRRSRCRRPPRRGHASHHSPRGVGEVMVHTRSDARGDLFLHAHLRHTQHEAEVHARQLSFTMSLLFRREVAQTA